MTDPMEDVRRIWSTVLGAEIQDVDVNFFDAGGHSLLVMVLQEHLEELAGRELAIEDLFEHPTIRAQAGLLADRPDAGAAVDAELGGRDRSQLLGRSGGATAGGLT
ncbi:acyl carrier protein [Streptomyces sp. XD-27]|uniref:acyl carrier protein n=1 Tax=Streptomyces sp. XD-27 TaxID=3062779 RepID=UPI0026F4750E|nr:acyl carrier protein [Streptomyces sp. XD-27]WKX73993.1 acyl carrier protein [Streptomyces sp. XD-27]